MNGSKEKYIKITSLLPRELSINSDGTHQILRTYISLRRLISQLVETNEIELFNEGFKSDDNFNNAFLSSAVINLKKSSGQSISEKSDLSLYVENDWDLISKQIVEINPDLIFCGSTWPIIEKHLKTQKISRVNKCCEWLYQVDQHYHVDYWHPANQYPSKLNYYSLLTALKFSMNKWSKPL